jgi:hypothetical protein
MNCKKFLFSFLSAFSLASTIGSPVLEAQISPTGFERAVWQGRCRELKRSLSQQPELNLTYQARPAKIAIQSSWQILWFGKRVPIPAANYSEAIVTGSLQERSVVMKGKLNGKLVRVILSRHTDTIIDDVFATAADSSTKDGKAITNQLFGSAVKLSQLQDLGFRYTPADLSCAAARWQKEVPVAIALILKGVASPNSTASAVYEIDRGQATLSQLPDADSWQAGWTDGTFLSQVYLQLPKAHPYGDLGLGVGRADWQVAQGQPKWLNALETAIAKPERGNWQALAIALKQAGMSEKSVKSVQAQ